MAAPSIVWLGARLLYQSPLIEANAMPLSVLSHINPLIGTGNYSVTSNNMKLVHWPLMGGLLPTFNRKQFAASWPRTHCAIRSFVVHGCISLVAVGIVCYTWNGCQDMMSYL